ncbi:MATE family efflux transporter [Mycoplasma elephantis]|uniref:MATE family efflux transporter n=1 Tax=Mycoplasma elephantis TaxID=114882 RepID=UPI0005614DE5|nr:MATE family efflux transporter [Mycoplasma elephantis]
MNNQKQEKAYKLFNETKVAKVIWIVGIPALLSAIMAGLYTFVDQLLIQQFTPETKPLFGDDGLIYGYIDGFKSLSSEELQELIKIYNSNITDKTKYSELSLMTSNTVVSTAIVSFNPIIIIINAIVLFIPVGSSVYYTKLIAKNHEKLGKDVWATVFWMSFIVGLISGMIAIFVSILGVPDILAGNNTYDNVVANKMGDDFLLMKAYFDAAHDLSVAWAKDYIYVYAGGAFIMALHVILSFLIKAEGRNNYVLFIAIISNISNILLDMLFIIVFKLGVLGGALATLIGWSINLLGYLSYCWYNARKQKTWLDINHLFKFKFKKNMLVPISLLGLSGFIRTFTIGFSIFVITFIFSHSEFSDPANFQYYWSKSNPILVLFMYGIFGITDGVRPLMSYNYANRNFKRCKETMIWGLTSAVIVAIVSIVLMNVFANQFVELLNVQDDKKNGSILFLRMFSFRILFFSPVIVALILFQGTNNVVMSNIVAAFEGFLSFVVIMSLSYVTGLLLYKNGYGTWVANMSIAIGWIINSFVTGLILGIVSFWYLYKKIPYIDQNKLTFLRKLEHKIIKQAEEYEKISVQKQD